MVTQSGMSDALGNVDLASGYANLSSETKQDIEREVRAIIEAARHRATRLLTDKRHELDLVATALVQYEVLNRDEMERILRGEKLDKLPAMLPGVPIKLPDLPAPSAIRPATPAPAGHGPRPAAPPPSVPPPAAAAEEGSGPGAEAGSGEGGAEM